MEGERKDPGPAGGSLDMGQAGANAWGMTTDAPVPGCLVVSVPPAHLSSLSDSASSQGQGSAIQPLLRHAEHGLQMCI